MFPLASWRLCVLAFFVGAVASLPPTPPPGTLKRGRPLGAAVRCVAGPIYRPGEGFREGWLLHEGGRVVDAGEGRPPVEPEARGVVLPSPVDAHTHVGDRVGRGKVDLRGRTLAEVVAPPHGLKHRLLAQTPEDELVAGMREALWEAARAGCRTVIDFREQGAAGVGMLRRAAEGTPVRPVVLGRLQGAWDDDEAGEVLSLADGFGLSAMRDASDDAPGRMSALARRRGKRFALHFSESVREDVGRALDLRPDFLVHVVASPREDLEAIAAARVPVVVCPRSNALFGRRPDVATLLDLGVGVALGSDNAMFHPLDVLEEARLLRRQDPRLAPAALLDAAIAGGARVRDGAAPRGYLGKGDAADFLVLEPRGDDPVEAVFGAAPRVVHVPFA